MRRWARPARRRPTPQAARVLLASNVARAYFQLARANDQLRRRAAHAGAARTAAAAWCRTACSAGLDTQLELRQSEGALPEARQQIEALREQAELAQHALAALTGQRQPRRWCRRSPRWRRSRPWRPCRRSCRPTCWASAPTSSPRAGASRPRATTWRTPRPSSIPTSTWWPSPACPASAWAACSRRAAQQWGVGPAIRLPIFDAGRLRANLRGKTADLDAAVESYNAAVLDAIRDVADQIASGQSIARQQAEQRARAGRGRRRLRDRRAALPGRPGHLPATC